MSFAGKATAVAELSKVLPDTYKFLQENFNDTSVKRDEAIKGIVNHLRKAHPDRNVVVCHTPHMASLENVSKMHMELRTGWVGTTGVDIYVFSHGTFTNLGDSGFINWCYGGKYVKDPNNAKSITFHRIT